MAGRVAVLSRNLDLELVSNAGGGHGRHPDSASYQHPSIAGGSFTRLTTWKRPGAALGRERGSSIALPSEQCWSSAATSWAKSSSSCPPPPSISGYGKVALGVIWKPHPQRFCLCVLCRGFPVCISCVKYVGMYVRRYTGTVTYTGLYIHSRNCM